MPIQILFLFIVSLCIGSFLTLIVERLPVMLGIPNYQREQRLTLLTPPSFCHHCEQPLLYRCLVPVFSYLYQKGRSLCCARHIPRRYLILELLCVTLSLLLYCHFGLSWQLFWGLVFTWSLLALAFIDFETLILPDCITIPLCLLGLLINAFSTFTSFFSACVGVIAGYLCFAFIGALMKTIRQQEMLGGGDYKLIAALGAWVGWQALPLLLLIASLAGSAVGLSYILLKNKTFSCKIPFGPFLGLAGYLVLILGPVHNGFKHFLI